MKTNKQIRNMVIAGDHMPDILSAIIERLPPLPEPAPAPFKIEAGKRYVDSNGDVHGPLKLDNGFWYVEREGGKGWWYPGGNAYTAGCYALIREYVEPTPPSLEPDLVAVARELIRDYRHESINTASVVAHLTRIYLQGVEAGRASK